MSNIYTSADQLIGKTPLLELTHIEKVYHLKAKILAKLELFNPGGSVKDRVAKAMIEDAEKKGILEKGALIIEPTSGNTGIGLAWVASLKGYRVILTMPETMSVERRMLLKACGATIELTPGSAGMKGAIARAEELQKANPGSVILGQFENPANPAAHEATTAQEIWRDTNGSIDIFVATVGTGGTLSGTARGLKVHNSTITAVGVEPKGSPVLEGGNAGPHKIQGIGAGFIPANYDSTVVDKIMPVSDDDAMRASRMLAEKEGLLAGISSGAALCAAIELARKEENSGKTIVALLPDTGERYMSTDLFDYDRYPL